MRYSVGNAPLANSSDVNFGYFITQDLTCKRGSVGRSEGLLLPRSSVRFRLKPENSSSHRFEHHRPSIKGTKLLLKVMKAIIIISDFKVPFLHRWGVTIPQALHFLVVKETSLLGLVNPTQAH